MSIASSLTSPCYEDLINDGLKMYDYIKTQEPQANITVYGMCAGSPVACAVAKNKGSKFFSDRSFTQINDVVDIHIGDFWLMRFILMPLRFIRRQFIHWAGYSIRQDEMVAGIPSEKRGLHAIVPSKAHNLKQDSMTRGSRIIA